MSDTLAEGAGGKPFTSTLWVVAGASLMAEELGAVVLVDIATQLEAANLTRRTR